MRVFQEEIFGELGTFKSDEEALWIADRALTLCVYCVMAVTATPATRASHTCWGPATSVAESDFGR
jgi:hypothetical protein